jgi:hypothetical protein
MLKKLVSVALAGLLINLVNASTAYAVSKEEKQARFAARVKEGVAKLGTGVDARLEVKLRDNTKLKGYVLAAGEDDFVVVGATTGKPASVAYSQVKQVRGNNLSTGVRIAIGVGIAVALVILVAVLLTTAAGGD